MKNWVQEYGYKEFDLAHKLTGSNHPKKLSALTLANQLQAREVSAYQGINYYFPTSIKSCQSRIFTPEVGNFIHTITLATQPQPRAIS
ncbi:MAG: hypothetical protein ACK4V9_12200 [Aphanizomenon sp.]